MGRLAIFALALILAGAPAGAQDLAGLERDGIATAAIVEATTEERFLTPWVSALPEHAEIPSPRDILGYTIGTPGELTQVEEIHAYMRALADASPRVAVFSAGLSHEGREMIVVAIADSDTIANIEIYKQYLRDLSDPRTTNEGDAEEIISEAKPIYWMTGGLHSPELGPPEMLMELAYRLAVEERAPFDLIRENVITLITPVVEVDGRARQVDWFRLHGADHDDYFERPMRSVPFWGHYTYHDNNRDGIMISQALMRNYVGTFFEWMPTLSLDLHESVPFLYVATGTGPYNPRVDPITVSEWASIANYEINRLTGFGLDGVWTWGYYTGWYPGYMLWVTNNHNSSGRFYETFGNGSANTMERDLSDSRFAGEEVTSQQWYRFVPPDREVTWSMRNNTNYMQSGVIASLEMTARNRELFLENFWRKGVNALRRSTEESPHAYVVPREQRDPGAATTLLQVLGRHGIELAVADEDETYGETGVEEGDILISLDQPYGPLARNLLERQSFPDSVDVPPYDDVAWTLGLVTGVDVNAIDDETVFEHEASPLMDPSAVFTAEPMSSRADVIAIANVAQRDLGPFRFRIADVPVMALEEEIETRGETLAPGSLIIELTDESRDAVAEALTASRLDSVRLSGLPDAAMHELDAPRIALWHSWIDTQNAGWVRYTLDEAGIPYDHIMKERVHAGDLRRDYDVILVPSFRGAMDLASVLAGADPGFGAIGYETSEVTPNIGHMVSSPDITGGLGLDGLHEIQRFVEAGGTLITLGSAGILATDSGMTRDIATSRPGGLNTPGSILSARITNTESPLVYGYPEVTHLFRTNGPLYRVADRDRFLAVMQFGSAPAEDDEDSDEVENEEADEDLPPLVLSGGVVGGAGAIDGAPAILQARLGEGNVVILGWNPMHRHVNHHDHAFVYNALLHWNDLPDPEIWRQVDDEDAD